MTAPAFLDVWEFGRFAGLTVTRAYRANNRQAPEFDTAHGHLWERTKGRGTVSAEDRDVALLLLASVRLDQLDRDHDAAQRDRLADARERDREEEQRRREELSAVVDSPDPDDDLPPRPTAEELAAAVARIDARPSLGARRAAAALRAVA